jgi:hypothetical protein
MAWCRGRGAMQEFLPAGRDGFARPVGWWMESMPAGFCFSSLPFWKQEIPMGKQSQRNGLTSCAKPLLQQGK